MKNNIYLYTCDCINYYLKDKRPIIGKGLWIKFKNLRKLRSTLLDARRGNGDAVMHRPNGDIIKLRDYSSQFLCEDYLLL